MKKLLGLVLGAAFFAACNNEAEETGVNEDSINQSSLDNRDENNRNTSVYDSSYQATKDTGSYERMPTKTSDSLRK